MPTSSPRCAPGAQGYILKSQPAPVVVAQLQRIEQGEPALSPSIAARVLRHFHDAPRAPSAAAASPMAQLTEREVEVLRLIAKGYKSGEVAQLLALSSHTRHRGTCATSTASSASPAAQRRPWKRRAAASWPERLSLMPAHDPKTLSR